MFHAITAEVFACWFAAVLDARAEADDDIVRFFHIVQDEVFRTQIEAG